MLCDSKYYKIRRNNYINIMFSDNHKISILKIDDLRSILKEKIGDKMKQLSYLQIIEEVFAVLLLPLKYNDTVYHLFIDELPDRLQQLINCIDVNFNE